MILSMSSPVVRDVRGADFDAIAALTNYFIDTTAVHFATEPVSAASMRELWVGQRERYPFVVAEVDGVFAGYAKAGQWRERAAYNWSAETGIYLSEEFRGQGIGKVLYAALLDAMRERGLHSAIGAITLPNDASVRLHEAVGFDACGVVRRAGWKFGAWYDVGFYQAMLQQPEHNPEDNG